MTGTERRAATGSGVVLLTLAAGQFLMTLDSSVMNVSIATVAKDVGTTVTGIQTAITFYTLVMASLMITGGKLGQILGRKRAFAIGCVIYACGSFITAISQSLTGADDRVVVSRGRRRRADPARDRRARGLELRAVGATAGLRPRRFRGRDRRRGRSADRRAVHDLRVVALGVRRRGPDRACDPRRCAPDRRHSARQPSASSIWSVRRSPRSVWR